MSSNIERGKVWAFLNETDLLNSVHPRESAIEALAAKCGNVGLDVKFIKFGVKVTGSVFLSVTNYEFYKCLGKLVITSWEAA